MQKITQNHLEKNSVPSCQAASLTERILPSHLSSQQASTSFRKHGTRVIWIIFFSLLLFFSPFPQRKASAWVDTVIPKLILPPMQTMMDQLMIVITGALKQAAVKMVTNNVYMSVSGGSGGGGTKFIVDWKYALTDKPKEEATLYIEQLTKNSMQMRGSSFYASVSSSYMADNFEGVGESGLAQYFQSPRFIDSANAQSASGSSGNYLSKLAEIGKSVTDENTCAISNVTPDNLFQNGNFKDLENFTDPYTYKACLQGAYEKKLTELKEEARTQAIAYQGFIGTEQNGNVTYPGILVKEKLANVENMGNEVVANANGIGEVIVSMVMQMGMNAMNNGIGNVKSQVQRNKTNTSERSQSQTQNQVNTQGLGSMYGNSSSSQ